MLCVSSRPRGAGLACRTMYQGTLHCPRVYICCFVSGVHENLVPSSRLVAILRPNTIIMSRGATATVFLIETVSSWGRDFELLGWSSWRNSRVLRCWWAYFSLVLLQVPAKIFRENSRRKRRVGEGTGGF